MADIHLTSGNDTYVQLESEKDIYNNIYGDDGDDVIRMYSGTGVGGKGNDRFEFIATPGQPWRSMDVAYWTSPTGVEVNLTEGWANDGFGGRDTLVGIRRVHGSGNNDSFIGDATDNFFQPNGGRDVIDGRDGNDGIQVREIPQNADGSGTWKPALLSDLNVVVSPDATTAVITVKVYTGARFQYTLSNIEYFTLMNDNNVYSLADFITPQSMAEQAIAAGGAMRWNATAALGSAVTVSFSFATSAAASGVGANGFRAFTPAEQQLVRDILAKTTQIANISFTEVAESGASAGQLRFGVSQQASTKGFAYLPGQAGDLAGDVWMDVESMLSLAPGSEGYGSQRPART